MTEDTTAYDDCTLGHAHQAVVTEVAVVREVRHHQEVEAEYVGHG